MKKQKRPPIPEKIDASKSNRYRRDYDEHARSGTVFEAAIKPGPNQFDSAEQAWASAKAEFHNLALRVFEALPPHVAAFLRPARGAKLQEFHPAWFITPLGRDVMDARLALRVVTQAIADGNDNLAGAWLFTLGRHLERIRLQLEMPKAPTRVSNHEHLRCVTLAAYLRAKASEKGNREPTGDAVLSELGTEGVKLQPGGKKIGWKDPAGCSRKLSVGRWRALFGEWRENFSHLAQT